MTGTERRNQIIERIRKNDVPVSGTMLAKEFEVSRQVIVQDIALIRAAGYDIISTHRGYLLNEPISVSRVFKVQHTDEQTEEELYSIVDLGGTVANVMVNINSRKKAKDFIDDIKSGKSSPLKNITSNYHYHKVVADSEETLDMIEEALQEKGFLVTAN